MISALGELDSCGYCIDKKIDFLVEHICISVCISTTFT